MNTIDRAALIEQAARSFLVGQLPGFGASLRITQHDRNGAAATLPVIAKALLAPLRELVSDWQANGNSRPLGDSTAEVWQKAAIQLLHTLDAIEAEAGR